MAVKICVECGRKILVSKDTEEFKDNLCDRCFDEYFGTNEED